MNFRLFWIAILLLLLDFTIQTCSRGCYRCNIELDYCEICGIDFLWNFDKRKCNKFEDEITRPILGCELYLTREKCQKCVEAFKLEKYKCIGCKVENCANCQPHVQKCKKCKIGFSSSDGTDTNCSQLCTKKNCDVCSPGQPENCTKCVPGFVLDPTGDCVVCLDPNCVSCDPVTKVCLDLGLEKNCKDRFFYNNTLCKPCEEGCLDCSSGGICLGCDVGGGFFMNDRLRCEKSGILLKAFFVIGIIIFLIFN